ncbi:MarC family integral membrane family protein 2, partial [Alcaligenes faecalis subsp. faecalis NCIB 8687]
MDISFPEIEKFDALPPLMELSSEFADVSRSFLFALATLLPMLNPPAAAPIFLTLTEGASVPDRAQNLMEHDPDGALVLAISYELDDYLALADTVDELYAQSRQESQHQPSLNDWWKQINVWRGKNSLASGTGNSQGRR